MSGRFRVLRTMGAALGALLAVAGVVMLCAHGVSGRLMIQRWGPGSPNSAVYCIDFNAAPWRDDGSGPGLYKDKPVKLNAEILGVRYLATMGTGGTWTRLWVPWAWVGAAGAVVLWASLRSGHPRQRLPR